MSGRRGSAARAIGYAALATVDIALAVRGDTRARRVTKPALMPVLMAGRDRRTCTALALGGLGDVALLGSGEAAFAAGLSSFLAGHLAWIEALQRRGDLLPPGALVRGGRAVATAGYVSTFGALTVQLWPRTGRHRPAVLAYSAVLLACALQALRSRSAATALGGGLFLASDSLLALERFSGMRLPAHEAWVMSTYTAAQALLAEGGQRNGPADR